MTKYNKFIAAAISALFAGLAAFGVIAPEGSEALAATISSTIGSILVYLIPNTE